MKIALLNDTHFGCRNDNPAFIEFQNKFYNEQFFPYLQQHNIKCLVHLGDVVDRRKFINHNTAHNFKKVFWDRLDDMGIETHIIIGNHDTYYKNTNETNCANLLIYHKNVNVYTKPVDKSFNGITVGFVPWICPDNYDESLKYLKTTKSQILFGHFEILPLLMI